MDIMLRIKSNGRKYGFKVGRGKAWYRKLVGATYAKLHSIKSFSSKLSFEFAMESQQWLTSSRI